MGEQCFTLCVFQNYYRRLAVPFCSLLLELSLPPTGWAPPTYKEIIGHKLGYLSGGIFLTRWLVWRCAPLPSDAMWAPRPVGAMGESVLANLFSRWRVRYNRGSDLPNLFLLLTLLVASFWLVRPLLLNFAICWKQFITHRLGPIRHA